MNRIPSVSFDKIKNENMNEHLENGLHKKLIKIKKEAV